MKNICTICGKEYEPYYAYGERQKTCSPECRAIRNQQYHEQNKERHRALSKIRYQKKRLEQNGHVLCRICGKPIYRTFTIGEGQPWMHYECVLDDCINTLRSGGKLSHKQLLRLEARGFTKREFIEEFRGVESC